MLADNGFKKEGDLRFLSAEVIKELPLSICSRAKLKELAKSFLKFRNAPEGRARTEQEVREETSFDILKGQLRRGITVSSR